MLALGDVSPADFINNLRWLSIAVSVNHLEQQSAQTVEIGAVSFSDISYVN